MSELPEDDHVLLARLIPYVEQHRCDLARLTTWAAARTPREFAPLVMWAQYRIEPHGPQRD